MIGTITSSKPARSRTETMRPSTRRRRALSAINSGLTPVGYRSFLPIKKPLPREVEEVSTGDQVLAAPLPFGGAHADAPLPTVMVVVVLPGGANVRHSDRSVWSHRRHVNLQC